MTSKSDDSGSAKVGRRLPDGRRLVIGIIVQVLIVGFAVSLTIRYVVHSMRDTIGTARETENAAGEPDAAVESGAVTRVGRREATA